MRNETKVCLAMGLVIVYVVLCCSFQMIDFITIIVFLVLLLLLEIIE